MTKIGTEWMGMWILKEGGLSPSLSPDVDVSKNLKGTKKGVEVEEEVGKAGCSPFLKSSSFHFVSLLGGTNPKKSPSQEVFLCNPPPPLLICSAFTFSFESPLLFFRSNHLFPLPWEAKGKRSEREKGA